MRQEITAQLVGGLGNQLFTYYAGAALAGLHGVGLRVDLTRTAHGATVRCFDLPGEWLPDQGESSGTELGQVHVRSRIVRRVSKRVPRLARALRYYESELPGYDPQLLTQPTGTTIRGYFQSWRIVQVAYDLGFPRDLHLRKRSRWLSESVNEARDVRPIVVHVRRGDYLSSASFGVLGAPYYTLALDTLRAQGLRGPVWVFSDDLVAASRLVPSNSRIMRSPVGPHEDLILMSHATGLVTANSSFSWWAAWLSSSPHVVSPASWFRAAEAPEGLIPPWWTRVSSTWA